MPDTLVDIPEVGRVAFPDSMSVDDISTAADELYTKARADRMFPAPTKEEQTDINSMADAMADANHPAWYKRAWKSMTTGLPIEKSMTLGKQIQANAGRPYVLQESDFDWWVASKIEEVNHQAFPEGFKPGVEWMTAGNSPELVAKFREEFQTLVGKPYQTANAPVERNRAMEAVGGAVSGAEQVVGGTLGFFSSPLGLALPATKALPAAGQAAVALGFMTQMASQLPDIWAEVKKAYKEGDVGTASKAFVEGIGQLAFVGATGAHGVKKVRESIRGQPTPQLQRTAPATAATVAATQGGTKAAPPAPPAAPLEEQLRVVNEELRKYEARLGVLSGRSAKPGEAILLENKAALEAEIGAKNASSQSKTAEVYGAVRPQPGEGQGQVPAPQGSPGIQPQPETTPGGPAQGQVGAEWFGPGEEPLEIVDFNPKKGTVLVRAFGDPNAPLRNLPADRVYSKNLKPIETGVEESGPAIRQVIESQDEAERAAIDVGDELGAGVVFTEEGDPNAPFARNMSRPIRDGSGRVAINRGEFLLWLDDIDPTKRAEAIRSLIDEESIHTKTPDKVALAYWNGLTAFEQALVKRRYTGKWGGMPERFDDTQMGHEALRGTLQQLSRMTPREVAEANGLEWLTVKSIYALEKAVFAIRRGLGTKASRTQVAMLDAVQANLSAALAIRGDGAEPEAFRKGDLEPVDREWDNDPLVDRIADTAYEITQRPLVSFQKRTGAYNSKQIREAEIGLARMLRKEATEADVNAVGRFLDPSQEMISENISDNIQMMPLEEASRLTADDIIKMATDELAGALGGKPADYLDDVASYRHQLEELAGSIRESATPQLNEARMDRAKARRQIPEAFRKGVQDENIRRALSMPVDLYERGRQQWNEAKARGEPVTRQQSDLTELVGDGPVFHETSLGNAMRIYYDLRRPFKASWTRFRVADNLDLAIGQGGSGVTIEMDPARLNGVKTRKPGTSESTGLEYSIDRSVAGSVRAVIFSNQRQVDAFRRRFPNSLDYTSASEADRGITNRKAGIRVPVKQQLPEAFRKGKKQKPEEGPELPLTQGGERPTGAEMGMLPNVPKEEVSAEIIGREFSKHMEETARPMFRQFADEMAERFGVAPGQLKDTWRDSIWNYLLNAKGSKLNSLLDKLGLRQQMEMVGLRGQEDAIADAPETVKAPPTLAEAMHGGMEAGGAIKAVEKALKETHTVTTPEQKTRLRAIATIGQKLIGQMDQDRSSLARKKINPDEVAYWKSSESAPAYRQLENLERKSPDLWRTLTEGGAVTRLGKKAEPVTVTRRLTALLDKHSGAVHLVSTYRHEGTAKLVDPARKHMERRSVPIGSLLSRFEPIESILLDEPVKDFIQSFKSRADYNEKFSAQVEENQKDFDAREHAYEAPEAPEIAPAPSAMLTKDPLTDHEAGQMYYYLTKQNPMHSIEDLQTTLEGLFKENRPRAKGGGREPLSPKEQVVVNGLFKAIRHEMEVSGVDQTVALNNVLESIYETATKPNADRGSFIKETLDRFSTKAQQPVSPGGPTPGPEPSEGQRPEYFDVAQARRKAEADIAAAEEARALQQALAKTELLSPSAYDEYGPAPPEAFRKPAVVQRLENSWDRLKESLRAGAVREGTFEQMAAWLDAAETMPANISKQARNALERDIDDSLPASLRGKAREAEHAKRNSAVIPVIQARGDYNALNTFEQKVRAGMLRETQANHIHGVEVGRRYLEAINYARRNWAELVPIARAFSRETRGQFRLETANGITLRYEQFYVPQRYEPEFWNDDSITWPSEGALGRKFREAKRFKTYFDAYEAGQYYAKSFSALDLLEHRVREGQNRIARRLWIERLRGLTDPHTGLPVITDLVDQQRILANGTTITEKTLPDAEHVEYTLGPGQGRVAIRKGYKAILDTLLLPGRVSGFEVYGLPVGHALLNLNALIKHGVLLIFDTFHPGRLTQMHAAATSPKEVVNKAWNKGWSALEYRDADLPRAVRAGLVSQEAADWSRQFVTVRDGTATRTMTRRQILEWAQREGLNVGKFSDALRKHVVENWPVIGGFNRWTFDRVTRGMIAHSAVFNFEKSNKAYPEMSSAELMRYVVRDANLYYGSIGRQGVLKSATGREVAQVFLLAPQWVERMLQSEIRATGRLVAAPFRIGSKKPKLGIIGKGVGRGLVAYFAMTQAINLITKGQLTFQNEDDAYGSHHLDAWIPDFTGRSPGYWLSPLSVFAEVSHDFMRYMEGVKHKTGFDAATQIAKNKLGPLGRFLMVLAHGGDQRSLTGDKLSKNKAVATAQVGLKAAAELAPVPISLGAPLRSAGHLMAPGIVPEQPPGAVQKQIMGSAGIKTTSVTNAIPPSGSSMIRTQMRKRAQERKEAVRQMQK
jgi:hypothetical protein